MEEPQEYPWDLAAPRPFSTTFPYAALTPRDLEQTENPLLCSFASRNALIVETISRGWHLDLHVLEYWMDMELRLIAIRNILIQHEDSGEFPLSYKSWVSPSYYGYRRSHEGRGAARRCVERSRDAFAILLAECRFLILKNPALTGIHGQVNMGALRDILVLEGRLLHHAWISALIDTWRLPVAGVFVYPRECHYSSWIVKLIYTDVPVYLVWGGKDDVEEVRKINRQAAFYAYRRLVPTSRDIDRASTAAVLGTPSALSGVDEEASATNPAITSQASSSATMDDVLPFRLLTDERALHAPYAFSAHAVNTLSVGVKRVADDIKQMAGIRYGFVVDAAPGAQQTDRPSTQTIMRSLGEGMAHLSLAPMPIPEDVSTLRPFIDMTLRANTGQAQLPEHSELLDLAKDEKWTSWACLEQPLSLRVLSEDGSPHSKTFYVFRENSQNPSVEYQVAVEDAAIALMCLRMKNDCHDLESLVKTLYDLGCRFYTVLPQRLTASPLDLVPSSTIPSFVGFGWRPHGYQFDSVDHAVYCDRLNTFLLSYRGRAAAKHGGIVGRIARDAVPVTAVLAGPSRFALHGQGALELHLSDGTVLLDDALSMDEEELVSGLFHVANSSSNPSNVKNVSLWPSEHTFQLHGANTGIWTHDAECWFVAARSRLVDGHFAGLTRVEWKKILNFAHTAGKLHRGARKLAEAHINQHPGVYVVL
ncbi:hypothetical protein BD626DRAFT_408609 [Schizophyllum amplum]|uniref:Uncharacterized protein n=1 Tax=Schizophyllum amplum TaxID=97359 RepID=A0A550C4G7_9AGAR|nr:hypothetical protein BD626DRAFT_408609 [Auriculariopsis ampla]